MELARCSPDGNEVARASGDVNLTDGALVIASAPMPAEIRIELTSPDGTVWAWGPDQADNRISGPALDFCLLVTQRRHRNDLALDIEGPAAVEWMAIAQAFAGTAGTGRPPRRSADD